MDWRCLRRYGTGRTGCVGSRQCRDGIEQHIDSRDQPGPREVHLQHRRGLPVHGHLGNGPFDRRRRHGPGTAGDIHGRSAFLAGLHDLHRVPQIRYRLSCGRQEVPRHLSQRGQPDQQPEPRFHGLQPKQRIHSGSQLLLPGSPQGVARRDQVLSIETRNRLDFSEKPSRRQSLPLVAEGLLRQPQYSFKATHRRHTFPGAILINCTSKRLFGSPA